MLGYGMSCPAYWIATDDAVKLVRSIKRVPSNMQWSKDKVEKMNVTRKSLHHKREARAVPLGDREEEEVDEEPKIRSRAARIFEIRQKDLDPAMGGIGWTEDCRACDRARKHGWNERKCPHSAGCRNRVEDMLKQSPQGKSRLELARKRMERWKGEDG